MTQQHESPLRRETQHMTGYPYAFDPDSVKLWDRDTQLTSADLGLWNGADLTGDPLTDVYGIAPTYPVSVSMYPDLDVERIGE